MSNVIKNLISSILLPKQLVVTFNGKTHQILRESDAFEPLYKAIKERNLDTIQDILEEHGYITRAIQNVAEQFNEAVKQDTVVNVKVYNSVLSVSDDGKLIINGVTFNNNITKKIAKLYNTGYDIKGYYKLLVKIAENPQAAVNSGLLDFIAENDLPITTDGTFLAYKVTKKDGRDYHSGSINYLDHMNKGIPVTMDRDGVDSSRGVCSGAGLYFASIGYYDSGYYSNISESARFIVEVDPVDVVSIPTSYNCSKGRCCKMRVLKQVDWDSSLVPNTMSIIDLSTWTSIKPTVTANTYKETLEVSGTQNLKPVEAENTKEGDDSIEDETIEDEAVTVASRDLNLSAAISKYILGRFSKGISPYIKDVQKAIKIPGTSVNTILNIVQELGYDVTVDKVGVGNSYINRTKSLK